MMASCDMSSSPAQPVLSSYNVSLAACKNRQEPAEASSCLCLTNPAWRLEVTKMPSSHEPEELRRMHEAIDAYYPRTYLDCWAQVGCEMGPCIRS